MWTFNKCVGHAFLFWPYSEDLWDVMLSELKPEGLPDLTIDRPAALRVWHVSYDEVLDDHGAAADAYDELSISCLVRLNGGGTPDKLAWHLPVLFVTSPVIADVGRSAFGFPKETVSVCSYEETGNRATLGVRGGIHDATLEFSHNGWQPTSKDALDKATKIVLARELSPTELPILDSWAFTCVQRLSDKSLVYPRLTVTPQFGTLMETDYVDLRRAEYSDPSDSLESRMVKALVSRGLGLRMEFKMTLELVAGPDAPGP